MATEAMFPTFAKLMAQQHQRSLDMMNNLHVQFSGVVEGLVDNMMGGGKKNPRWRSFKGIPKLLPQRADVEALSGVLNLGDASDRIVALWDHLKNKAPPHQTGAASEFVPLCLVGEGQQGDAWGWGSLA